MKYVTLPGGDIVVTSSDVPSEIANYVRDAGMHRLFHPAFVACKFRLVQSKVRPCGKVAVCWYCNEKRQTVTVPFCDVCEVEPKM